MSAESKETNRMIQFLREHANTWLKLDLLFFWNKHPYAKFTSGVIARTLDYKRRAEVDEALDSLVKDELVERHTQQGLLFYCLTSDPEKRECVLNLPAYRNSLSPAILIEQV